MFSSEKNIALIVRLLNNFRKYGELRLQALQLDAVSKLTLLLSAILVGVAVLCFSGLAILLLSMSAVYFLAPHVGGLAVACFLLALVYVVLGLICFIARRSLFINPITRFVATILLSEHDTSNAANMENLDDELYFNPNQERKL